MSLCGEYRLLDMGDGDGQLEDVEGDDGWQELETNGGWTMWKAAWQEVRDGAGFGWLETAGVLAIAAFSWLQSGVLRHLSQLLLTELRKL
ncbi:hypothetical protein Y032_0382g364 [Ancylostoma ceylanicum]|uniref:Uncharacterized protein n=1 Tax=Ancylostoma ceylanicum TaxID=53326 RepID=A0A016RT27_9BILA|nr:hypothetical protein Y032_0382g364 [Ancylostoma ceylanicum]